MPTSSFVLDDRAMAQWTAPEAQEKLSNAKSPRGRPSIFQLRHEGSVFNELSGTKSEQTASIAVQQCSNCDFVIGDTGTRSTKILRCDPQFNSIVINLPAIS